MLREEKRGEEQEGRRGSYRAAQAYRTQQPHKSNTPINNIITDVLLGI